MRRATIVILATAVLIGLAYGLTKIPALHLDWDKAIAITGVIGVAAAIAALIEAKRRVRKANFTISEASLEFKEEVFKGYKLSVTLINDGDEADVLHQINHQLYNLRMGFIESILSCGGRPITKDTGHVLPIECLPRVLYRVDGIGDILVKMPIYERLDRVNVFDDYVLRCTFIFTIAKPITIRVSRNGIVRTRPFLLTVRELMLRLKSLNKNPFLIA